MCAVTDVIHRRRTDGFLIGLFTREDLLGRILEVNPNKGCMHSSPMKTAFFLRKKKIHLNDWNQSMRRRFYSIRDEADFQSGRGVIGSNRNEIILIGMLLLDQFNGGWFIAQPSAYSDEVRVKCNTELE